MEFEPVGIRAVGLIARQCDMLPGKFELIELIQPTFVESICSSRAHELHLQVRAARERTDRPCPLAIHGI